MTDHTPTTEEVREEWAYGNQEVDHDGSPVTTLDEAFAQFDRWLAAHDRKIAAEALRELVADRMDIEGGVRLILEGADDPQEMIADWIILHARNAADRIEHGGES